MALSMSTLPMLSRAFLLLVAAMPLILFAAEQDLTSKISPADARITAAQKKIKASPDSFQSYNELAFAFCRKARDTGDLAFYDQAQTALDHSLKLSSGNYDARKLRATVLLGKHDFEQALKLATELNHTVPDDIAGWGLLVDSNITLHHYDEAERDAQWILDLRAGSTLGFEKAAAVREVLGDVPGAIEFLDEARRRTSQNDADQQAWLLTEKARLELSSKNYGQTEELLVEALKLDPNSRPAVELLAKVRQAQESARR